MDFSVFYANTARLENDLNLPPGFIEALVEEDDWSFIIKAHALIEAALSRLLTHEVDARLQKVFERMQLRGGISKTAFVRDLELLQLPVIKLIDRFAELRNSLVHDVSQTRFALASWASGLSKGDVHAFIEGIAAAVELPLDEQIDPDLVELFRLQPKYCLAFAVLGILATTLFRLDPSERDAAKAKAKKEAPLVVLAIVVAAVIHGLKKDPETTA